MRVKPIVALMLLASAAPAQSTADLLNRGITAYEAFQVEAARPFFKQIVSPSYLSPVSAEQKVTALKYLGASYAVLANTDSAEMFFSAALEFDPFTDLDPSKFSASELGPFNVAKRKIFKVGMRPITSAVVDPNADTTAYRFLLVSTHRAQFKVELIRQPDGNLKEPLFSGSSDGLKEIRWDGLMRASNNGRIADSATYILRVEATSQVLPPAAAPTVEQQFLRIEHAYEPLEDTLPPLPDSLLLPGRIPFIAPWLDLAKGAVVGVAAYVLPKMLLNDDVSWTVHAVVGGALGIGAGTGSFLYRSKKREIPENVAENRSRQQQRTDFNEAVRVRNARRIAATRLIITPLTGR